MLDTTTKRRIDTARDLLVGKVPDPKSQVEQITIALIYKFMDDIDAESEEFGGTRTFFAGDFARFGWAKLMHSGLGGHEILNLYAEAITRMPENPGIPPLFRDIFKNAFLPYRDPETLRGFLKVIDEFTYDHSERLGDAFEYLLSVLGSQGDAGQFRTPRHIIDFIVAVIGPKKNETILDPACGTAGFLISSYKHILKANTDADGHSTLTPDEKGRLATNFQGYDISPDMVRLSLVNMYLHGFAAPHIFEYDTLTSQDRWSAYADVILANPPFMSPKGGIRPHNRFSVQSKRSEVLFVDYIAEHLTPNGRAGIIVPEGVIFQSQNAYKQLRKLLVEDYLVAVVSLPAGVFQPYSGVKTSILILDKTLAKKTDRIAFFKVENDGFDLGAQRRAIDRNDLPQVQVELTEYLSRLRAEESVDGYRSTLGLIVEKERVAAGGEYNLSGERYRETLAYSNAKWPLVELGEVCETASGGTPARGKASYYEAGKIPWLRSGEVSQGEIFRSELFITEEGLRNSSAKIFRSNTVLVAMYGATAGEVGILRFDACTNQAICGITPDNRLLPDFLYLLLKANKRLLIRLAGGGAQPNISQKIIRKICIPLPPLEVQREIVAEIEAYQKVIDGARVVVENYRPHIMVDPEWSLVPLRDICSLGGTITKDVDLTLPYFGADSIESDTGKLLKIETARDQRVSGPVYEFAGERLLYSKIRPYLNKLTVIDLRGYCSSDMYPLSPNRSKAQTSYLATYMLSAAFNESIRGYYERANIPKINRAQLFETEIPLPPLGTQQAIVSEIEAEQSLVNANHELIERFEKKIRATVGRVGGETEVIGRISSA